MHLQICNLISWLSFYSWWSLLFFNSEIIPMMAPCMKSSSVMQISGQCYIEESWKVHVGVSWAEIQQCGSEQISVLSVVVGVKWRIVFNGSDSEQCPLVSDPFSLCIVYVAFLFHGWIWFCYNLYAFKPTIDIAYKHRQNIIILVFIISQAVYP